MKTKRQSKPKEGDVFAIPLGDGTFGYAQMCVLNTYAYFDCRSDSVLSVDEIQSCPILFKVLTNINSIKDGGWVFLENRSLRKELAERQEFWRQSVGSNQIDIYRNGEFVPATLEEIEGLENFSSWYHMHIVERILDHYLKRKNGVASRVNKIVKY